MAFGFSKTPFKILILVLDLEPEAWRSPWFRCPREARAREADEYRLRVNWVGDSGGEADTRRSYADFVTLLEEAFDPGVGRVVDGVDDAGLGEETLICFATEDGIAFGMDQCRGVKCHPTDAGLGVTTLLRHSALNSGPVDTL